MDLNHPFVLGHYHLMTPDIRRLSKQLRFWVYASIKGAMILGDQRIGKTYAIEHIAANIDRVLGHNCYAFYVDWSSAGKLKEKDFWKRLLQATGYDTTLRGEPWDLEMRFYERIVVLTQELETSVCVMFIDEAQEITLDQYTVFCRVFNMLEKQNIRLYTWLVGQQELKHHKTLMREANMKHVIARLMRHTFEMRGISTGRTLKGLLRQLDTLEYPTGSKTTFPAAAVSMAVESGFELANLADDFWKAKRVVDKKKARSKSQGWTMEEFQSIVATLLQNLERIDDSVLSVSQDDLEEIIELILTEETFSADDESGEEGA